MIHHAIYTVDEVLASYHAWSPADRLRFDQARAADQALPLDANSYRRCTAVRLQRVAQRNETLHQLITDQLLPTATLENWRNLHAQLSSPYLPATPQGLRRSYRKWLQTIPPTRQGAA